MREVRHDLRFAIRCKLAYVMQILFSAPTMSSSSLHVTCIVRTSFACSAYATKLLLFVFFFSFIAIIVIIIIIIMLRIIIGWVIFISWHCKAGAQDDSHLNIDRFSIVASNRIVWQRSIVFHTAPSQNELMCKLCIFWNRRSKHFYRCRRRRRHRSEFGCIDLLAHRRNVGLAGVERRMCKMDCQTF